MPTAAPVRCSQCGADLKVRPTDDSVTCSYCGTTSYLQRRGASIPPPARPVFVAEKGPSALIVVVLVGVVLGAILGVVLYVQKQNQPPSRVPVASATAATAATPVVAESEPPVPPGRLPSRLRLQTERRPLLVDVDGDETLDVVILSDQGYVALSGKNGNVLWKLGGTAGAFVAVAGGRLLVMAGDGQVTGFDVKTAERQWSTALGDKGERFCGGSPRKDSVVVPVVDGRVLDLDVKTGKQSPSGAKVCGPIATDQPAGDDDPRDRSDPDAPDGVVGVACGRVTVMGDQNFVVPDACNARLRADSDNLDGMAAHRIWQLAGGDWLAFGVRNPGTHAPLVGVVHKKKLAWKADVPPGNPLDAADGGPRPALLADDRVVAGWSPKAESSTHLAAFAVSDGKRLWDVAIPGARVDRAVFAGGEMWLYVDGRIEVRSVADGSLTRRLPAP